METETPSKVTREQIKAKLNQKREANKRSYMDLIRMGAELDPASMMMIRVDTLLELILSEEQRELFELAFETKLTEVIANAKTDMSKETLTKPMKRPGLILP